MRQKAGVDASARASDRVLLLPSIALGVHGRIDAMTGSTARLRRVQLIRDKDAGAPIASSAAPPVSPTPKSDDGAEEASPLERASADYTCSDDAFLVGDRCYDRQYAHLYFQRLRRLAPAVQARARAIWPDVPLRTILKVEEGVECAVVGTVYKDMKLKPSVLDEYTNDRSLKPLVEGAKFISEGDALILEDEGARMTLGGDGSVLPVDDLVSGVIIAVRGVEVPGSRLFEVRDICFPGPAPMPKAIAPALPATQDGDKFVALVSGLEVGGAQDPLPLQMLVDFLIGFLGCGSELELASKVTRVVIAGNSLGDVGAPSAEPQGGKEGKLALSALKRCDMALTQLASAMPVDVMPGPRDPTNVALPQQPLNKCLFPSTTTYANFGRVTNPHRFVTGGRAFLGCAGQNLDDVMRYLNHEDILGCMASLLEW